MSLLLDTWYKNPSSLINHFFHPFNKVFAKHVLIFDSIQCDPFLGGGESCFCCLIGAEFSFSASACVHRYEYQHLAGPEN